MKLKPTYISQDLNGKRLLVPVGKSAMDFNGMAEGNQTAAFIIDCLKTETTEAAIVEKMAAEYDASREQIAAGVKSILATLRSIHAIEE